MSSTRKEKETMKSICNGVNEALFEVALILATGLFRARKRSVVLPSDFESDRDNRANSTFGGNK